MTIPTFAAGLTELADRFDCFLVAEEVLHDGRRPFDGAVETLTHLAEFDKSVILLTNSALRATPNMGRLESLGIPRASYTLLVSAGEAIWQALLTGAFGPPYDSGSRVFVLGKPGEDYGFDGLDLAIVDHAEHADFILMMDRDGNAATLDQDSNRLLAAAKAHVPALCADPDEATSGALARVYEGLGGKVTYVGQPFPAIYRTAAGRASSDAARVLCLGNRLERDTLGPATVGFTAALVRTGPLSDVEEAPLRRQLEALSHKPALILSGLL